MSGSTQDPRNEVPPDGLVLLDDAIPDPELLSFSEEEERLRRQAVDPELPVAERVEAYEGIVDLEVGDTNLVRARNVERETGTRQLFLKFEGGNPTGTQKDRVAFALAHDALRRGFATCGNFGAALSFAASLAGLRCLVFVPTGYRTRRLNEIGSYGAEIVRSEGDYETAVRRSVERAAGEELYDANPGGANTPLQLRAYAAIADEIYDELRDAPAAVAVPVSNGTTLAGIYRGFRSLYQRGRTSRMPRMIAGSSFGKNPIVRSFARGLEWCEDLEPGRVKETAVNEPLINWHAFDGDLALQAVRRSGGQAGNASDREMMAHARLLRTKEGLQVLPASTAGLAVLLRMHREQPLVGDRHVAEPPSSTARAPSTHRTARQRMDSFAGRRDITCSRSSTRVTQVAMRGRCWTVRAREFRSSAASRRPSGRPSRVIKSRRISSSGWRPTADGSRR
jgi:threonine synthase